MELKQRPGGMSPIGARASNCTNMELKRAIRPGVVYVFGPSNCTNMELKLWRQGQYR